jgi:hypothetical protein
VNLSADADTLLRRAREVDHAVDLYLAPGATRLVADRLVEILHRAPSSQLSERALWNVLFATGELSLRTDLYRSIDLFRAAVALCERLGDEGVSDGRATAVEMSFDFFFARGDHPLLPLRAREVITALVGLFGHGRVATRAALHGLGHLVALGRAAGLRPLELDAVAAVDDWTQGNAAADDALRELAEEARTGSVR